MCDDEDVDGVEVDFVDITAVLDEDDGLQFQLPPQHNKVEFLISCRCTGYQNCLHFTQVANVSAVFFQNC